MGNSSESEKVAIGARIDRGVYKAIQHALIDREYQLQQAVEDGLRLWLMAPQCQSRPYPDKRAERFLEWIEQGDPFHVRTALDLIDLDLGKVA